MTTKNDEKSGVNVERLQYFVGERSWAIRKEGHLPKHADKMAQAVQEFEDATQKFADNKMEESKAMEIAKKSNRTILENALEPKGQGFPDGFIFDEVLNDFGWKTVEGMAVDLKLFLVDYGGKEKYQLWKEQSKRETKDFRQIFLEDILDGAITVTASVQVPKLIWITKQDSEVCPICEQLEGKTWLADEPDIPRPVQDTHFECRCRLLPSEMVQ